MPGWYDIVRRTDSVRLCIYTSPLFYRKLSLTTINEDNL